MLELKNICVKAGEFRLKNISFNIEEGSYHALIGPSGSGKTMLLNTIAGFQRPISGQIFYANQDITQYSPEKRGIAYLFQDLALFPHKSVFDNVAYSLKNKNLSKLDLRKKVNEYLDFTGISALSGRSIEKLSGGEKQRVALSRILITEASLIMLDEPFSAIDTQMKPGLKELLKKISQRGISIIHVTHDYNEIKNLADSITVIEEGEVGQSGNIETVMQNFENDFLKSFLV